MDNPESAASIQIALLGILPAANDSLNSCFFAQVSREYLVAASFNLLRPCAVTVTTWVGA